MIEENKVYIYNNTESPHSPYNGKRCKVDWLIGKPDLYMVEFLGDISNRNNFQVCSAYNLKEYSNPLDAL